jgi:hypothetical protein
MSKADTTAAEIRLGTKLVWGAGRFARVSRCLSQPMVHLYATRAECDDVAVLGKKCCPDCVGAHSTIEVLPLVDTCPVELGYREKRG